MYRVTFANPRVSKALENLPEKIQIKITESILELETDPRPHGASMLSGDLGKFWRIRIGSYRILYKIFDEVKQIAIARIGHRSQVYRM